MLFVLIIILIIFTGFSAIMSGTETAFFSLPPYTLNSYKKSKDYKKQTIALLLNKPQELLVTILILNILCNILIQNTVSSLFGNISGWVLKVGVPLAITLVLGEIIPKSFAIANNTFIANKVAIPLNFFYRLIAPVRKGLTRFTNGISHYLFFFLKKPQSLSTEELKMVVTTSEKEGVLTQMEKQYIYGYLNLFNTITKEKMRPRDEVVFFKLSDSLDHLIYLFKEKKLSKIPVCKNNLNDVLGIIHFQSFFMHLSEISTTSDLVPFLSKPLFIPETTLGWDAFVLMEEKKEPLALIVDEYGMICGLMTKEDLFESIVGEVHDLRAEPKNFRIVDENVIIARGKMEIEEFEKHFHVQLQTKTNPTTMAGFLIDQLEEIPLSGTKFKTQNFLFYILNADEKKIDKIFIRWLKNYE